MLKARVIPCLDVKDGRVVKGVSFVDLIDAGDPVEAAKAYDAAGADELTFLDITASSDDRSILFDVVSQTAEHCFIPLTVGGGIRSVENMREMLLAGADKVGVNTSAVSRRMRQSLCLAPREIARCDAGVPMRTSAAQRGIRSEMKASDSAKHSRNTTGAPHT